MPNSKIGTEPYREELLTAIKDPDEAAHYLNACLEDQNPKVFLMALRDVAEAHGGMRNLSRRAELNRESLYRMLSKKGNPSFGSLVSVLQELGLRLRVQPKRGRPRRAA